MIIGKEINDDIKNYCFYELLSDDIKKKLTNKKIIGKNLPFIRIGANIITPPSPDDLLKHQYTEFLNNTFSVEHFSLKCLDINSVDEIEYSVSYKEYSREIHIDFKCFSIKIQ
jgi:hypothetical protein